MVIVSYSSRELLRRCLDSLRAHPPGVPMNVVVVDNDSRDGTTEMVAAEYPEIDLIASPTNLGFSAATNLGARRGQAPYLLALNPDTAVTEGALDTVLAALEGDQRAAVAGPRLLTEDGSLDHAGRRSFPTPLSALGHFTGIGRRPGARGKLAAYRAPHVESGEVDAVNGAFMLMRRSAFDRTGGFDEGYWLYMEDLDLSYRLAQAGWTSLYVPAATVLHAKGGSTGGERSIRLNWAFHKGMFRFYRLHYAPERSPFLNALVYLGIGVKFTTAIAHASLRRILDRLRHRRPRVAPSDGGSGSVPSGG